MRGSFYYPSATGEAVGATQLPCDAQNACQRRRQMRRRSLLTPGRLHRFDHGRICVHHVKTMLRDRILLPAPCRAPCRTLAHAPEATAGSDGVVAALASSWIDCSSASMAIRRRSIWKAPRRSDISGALASSARHCATGRRSVTIVSGPLGSSATSRRRSCRPAIVPARSVWRLGMRCKSVSLRVRVHSFHPSQPPPFQSARSEHPFRAPFQSALSERPFRAPNKHRHHMHSSYAVQSQGRRR